jgi:hypothetical protein
MVADPPALLSCRTRAPPADGGTLMGLGAMPLACIGAPPRRISGIATRGAFLPPHCGRARLPQRPDRSSWRSAPSRSGWLGGAAAADAVVCARAPTHGRGGLSALPSQSPAVIAPRWPGGAGCSRRPSRSAGCRSPRRPDSGRPGHGLGYGIGDARSVHSAGPSNPPGGDAVRANACRCCHPRGRQAESLSCGHEITARTVITHEPRSLG